MKKYIIVFTVLLSYISSQFLSALNRDYSFICDQKYNHISYSHYCLECKYDSIDFYGLLQILDEGLLFLIPQTGPKCLSRKCKNFSYYNGYTDLCLLQYFSNFKRHLIYCRNHESCHCYWPEYSKIAAEISDAAYVLFNDLISTTSLSRLLQNHKEQKRFIGNESWFLDLHGLTISFIAHQFHFSDYYYVCRDIENYANFKYSEKESEEIKEKLENILVELYPKFLVLYNACFEEHPNQDIEQEVLYMKLLVNDISIMDEEKFLSRDKFCSRNQDEILTHFKNHDFYSYLEKGDAFIKWPYRYGSNFSQNELDLDKLTKNKRSPASDILLEQGTILNNLMLYNEAIKVLSQAIKLNSSNKNAFIERALAYFELNKMSLAIKDYESAKDLNIVYPYKDRSYKAMSRVPVYIPQNKIDFSTGLVKGTLEGAKVSTQELIPSVFSCCRGILHGLWAFVCSPTEVSQEMISTAYAIGEFISLHNTEECLQCVVPELRELSLNWHTLNDHSRGQKIGFIIGKYGTDIFAPIATFKGIKAAFNGTKKIIALKRANTMLTLECCVASQTKQAKIIEESIKRATAREAIAKSANSGKILVKSSNVQPHVMQTKHSWDRVVQLSGNVEEDFKKVLKLIEDHNIVNKANIKDTFMHKHLPISVTEYGMKINGYEIRVFMEHYIEKGETFLKNAYVQTP